MPIQADPLACGDWETKVEFCPKLKQKKGKAERALCALYNKNTECGSIIFLRFFLL